MQWLVLEMRVKLSAQDERGGTALHITSVKNLLPLVQWIVEHDSSLVALRTFKRGSKQG